MKYFMSEVAEIIDFLEDKIKKLCTKIDNLEQNSIAQASSLEKAATMINKQTREISELKSECEALKISNSLLGSDENKRETKLKINSLIREIDNCISQFSE